MEKSHENDSIFLSGPIRQSGVVRSCVCDADIKRPHKGQIEAGFHGEIVTRHWCLHCGRPLSLKDIDKHFPQQDWTDKR